MKPEFTIALSIVSHGDADKISRLLASLRVCELDLSRYQLILTDNLMDELPDFDPAAWGRLDLLRNKGPLGFAENHNRAFEVARAEYFAILNPDLIFERPILEELSKSLRDHSADLIAPSIVDENDAPQDSFRDLPSPLELIRRRLPAYAFTPPMPDSEGIIHPDWIAGMFWLLPSETYRRLGGLDEKFFLYLEDVDFCTRARLQGMKIIVDSRITVIHQAQRSSRGRLKYLFLHIQSAIKFFTSSVYRRALGM